MVFVREKSLLILALVLFAPAAVSAADEAHGARVASDAELRAPIERRVVVRTAIAKNPGLSAARHRARADRAEGEGEGSLPPPELMLEIWQVPITRPLAFGDAGMIQVGIKQDIPAPGSLSKKREVFQHRAELEQAQAGAQERAIARQASHAFFDYAEAIARHRIHSEHRSVAERTLGLAQARQTAGGALAEVAAAEIELARADAELALDEARIGSARARLNGLLGREPEAPLGPPVDEGARTLGDSPRRLADRPGARRPELDGLRAERAAQLAAAEAASREAVWPAFSVGALYFPPTVTMPDHGYGVSLSASLPWLWGGARDRREAARERALASEQDIADQRRSIAVEMAAAVGAVNGETARLSALETRVLPAAERARRSALAGYEASRTNILALLEAERVVVDARMELVAARAALDHALVELDWAFGVPVKRVPVTADTKPSRSGAMP